jgi:arylsulfatase
VGWRHSSSTGKRSAKDASNKPSRVGFSIDEGCDIGWESGSPVSPEYEVGDNRFSGEVNWVEIDIRGEDFDREVPPEQRYQAAMVTQ